MNASRQPRAGVTVNGVQLVGCVESFETTNNNWFASDTFDITLALTALPTAYPWQFFADNQIEVGVQAGFGDQGALTTLVQGYADKVSLDLPNGKVALRGRDRSSDFIDTKTDLKYQNLTASQIAAKLVANHPGLTGNITPTTTLAGRYYEIDHARLTNNVTEWTLLNYLAEEEGFDCYMTGSTLNFVPSQQGGQPSITVTYQPGQGDYLDLQLERSMTLAKDVRVEVISWNAKQAKAFRAVATRAASARAAFNDAAQLYTYKIPGLTQDQAQTIANARLDAISKHEREVTLRMPGELDIMPRSVIQLTGTASSFDQTYYVDSIRREMSLGGGFVETIGMKNHTPESTVGV